MKFKNNPIYQTSEIIVNSNGRVLNADKAFCEIFNCKNPEASHNSIILDYVAESSRAMVVNAFIDTFYSKQEGKLFKIQMLDFAGKALDVSIIFSPIKYSNGEKATLLIRKKLF